MCSVSSSSPQADSSGLVSLGTDSKQEHRQGPQVSGAEREGAPARTPRPRGWSFARWAGLSPFLLWASALSSSIKWDLALFPVPSRNYSWSPLPCAHLCPPRPHQAAHTGCRSGTQGRCRGAGMGVPSAPSGPARAPVEIDQATAVRTARRGRLLSVFIRHRVQAAEEGPASGHDGHVSPCGEGMPVRG